MRNLLPKARNQARLRYGGTTAEFLCRPAEVVGLIGGLQVGETPGQCQSAVGCDRGNGGVFHEVSSATASAFD